MLVGFCASPVLSRVVYAPPDVRVEGCLSVLDTVFKVSAFGLACCELLSLVGLGILASKRE